MRYLKLFEKKDYSDGNNIILNTIDVFYDLSIALEDMRFIDNRKYGTGFGELSKYIKTSVYVDKYIGKNHIHKGFTYTNMLGSRYFLKEFRKDVEDDINHRFSNIYYELEGKSKDINSQELYTEIDQFKNLLNNMCPSCKINKLTIKYNEYYKLVGDVEVKKNECEISLKVTDSSKRYI